MFTGAHRCNHYTTLSIYHSEWPRSMHHTYLHVSSFTVTTKECGNAKWINTWQSICSFFIPCGLRVLTWWKFINILLSYLAMAHSPSERNKHSHKSTQLPVQISMWISDNSKISVNVLMTYNTKNWFQNSWHEVKCKTQSIQGSGFTSVGP